MFKLHAYMHRCISCTEEKGLQRDKHTLEKPYNPKIIEPRAGAQRERLKGIEKQRKKERGNE